LTGDEPGRTANCWATPEAEPNAGAAAHRGSSLPEFSLVGVAPDSQFLIVSPTAGQTIDARVTLNWVANCRGSASLTLIKSERELPLVRQFLGLCLAHPPVPVLARRLDDAGHVSLQNVALLRKAVCDLRHLRQVVGTAGVAFSD
jgi:hypothetical protein